MVLFEMPHDLQPIMCFNTITWSKRHSLSNTQRLDWTKPPDFQSHLVECLFPLVEIGGSIPSLRIVLENFRPHTLQQLILYGLILINLMPTELDLVQPKIIILWFTQPKKNRTSTRR